jgi:hypothetical protein
MDVRQEDSGDRKWQIRIFRKMKSVTNASTHSGFIYENKEAAENDKELFKWFYSERKTRIPTLPNPNHNWKRNKPEGVEWDNVRVLLPLSQSSNIGGNLTKTNLNVSNKRRSADAAKDKLDLVLLENNSSNKKMMCIFSDYGRTARWEYLNELNNRLNNIWLEMAEDQPAASLYSMIDILREDAAVSVDNISLLEDVVIHNFNSAYDDRY